MADDDGTYVLQVVEHEDSDEQQNQATVDHSNEAVQLLVQAYEYGNTQACQGTIDGDNEAVQLLVQAVDEQEGQIVAVDLQAAAFASEGVQLLVEAVEQEEMASGAHVVKEVQMETEASTSQTRRADENRGAEDIVISTEEHTPFKCPVCQRTFISNVALQRHAKSHEEQGVDVPIRKSNYPCGICDRSYLSKRAWKRHQRKAHGVEDGKTDVSASRADEDVEDEEGIEADRYFGVPDADSANQDNLDEELKIEQIAAQARKDGFVLRCGECDRIYPSKGSLKRHMVVVHGPKSDGDDTCCCNLCGAVFLENDDLAQHMKDEHEQELIERAAEQLKMKGQGQVSMAIEDVTVDAGDDEWVPKTKQKFACGLCEKSYPTKNSLKKHMIRVHVGNESSQPKTRSDDRPRNFVCGACDRRYISRDNLRRHMKETHWLVQALEGEVQDFCSDDEIQMALLDESEEIGDGNVPVQYEDEDDQQQQDVMEHGDVTPYVDAAQEADVAQEEDVAEEAGVAQEADVAQEEDMKDVAQEADVAQEEDMEDVAQEANVAQKPGVAQEADVTQADVTQQADVTPHADGKSEANDMQQTTDDLHLEMSPSDVEDECMDSNESGETGDKEMYLSSHGLKRHRPATDDEEPTPKKAKTVENYLQSSVVIGDLGCGPCGKTFAHKYSLNRHLESPLHKSVLKQLHEKQEAAGGEVEFGVGDDEDGTGAEADRSVSEAGEFRCEPCDKTFAHENSLNRHRQSLIHKSVIEGKSQEGVSEERVKEKGGSNERGPPESSDDFEKDFITLEGGGYECITCGSKIMTRRGLQCHLVTRMHKAAVAGEEKLDDKDDESFIQNSNGEYECSLCDKVYVSSYNLRRHMETQQHKNNVEGLTNKQDKEDDDTTTPAKQKRHLDTESAKENLKDGKKTAAEETNSVLQFFVKTKDGVYKCKTCDVTIVRISNLQRHLDTVMHKNNMEGKAEEVPVRNSAGRYECILCDTSYSSNHDLKRHYGTKLHKDAVWEASQRSQSPALQGKQTTKSTPSTPKELPKVEFPCRACGKTFPYKYTYEQHLGSQSHKSNVRAEFERRLKAAEAEATAKDQPLGKFVCEPCGTNFPTRSLLLSHFQSDVHKKKLEAAKKPLTPLMKKGTVKLMESPVEGSSQSPGQEFVCTPCGTQYTRRQHLVRHLETSMHRKNVSKNSEKKDRGETSVRKEVEKESADLEEDESVEDPDTTIEEELCEFACFVCGTVFLEKELLDEHMDEHEDDEDEYAEADVRGTDVYPCEICDRYFQFEKGLIRHMQKFHSGDVPAEWNARTPGEFACDLCDKVYRYKRGLKEHRQRIHKEGLKQTDPGNDLVDENGFTCRRCDKSFPFNFLLVRHLKRAHGMDSMDDEPSQGDTSAEEPKLVPSTPKRGRKFYTCGICNRVYPYHSDLIRHHLGSHPEMDLGALGIKMEERKELEKSLSGEDSEPSTTKEGKGCFPCPDCERVYSYERGLKRHQLSSHPAEVDEFVEASPSMMSTPMTPSRFDSFTKIGENKYPCTVCGKVLLSRTTWKRHCLSHGPGEIEQSVLEAIINVGENDNASEDQQKMETDAKQDMTNTGTIQETESPGTIQEKESPGTIQEKESPGTIQEKESPGTIRETESPMTKKIDKDGPYSCESCKKTYPRKYSYVRHLDSDSHKVAVRKCQMEGAARPRTPPLEVPPSDEEDVDLNECAEATPTQMDEGDTREDSGTAKNVLIVQQAGGIDENFLIMQKASSETENFCRETDVKEPEVVVAQLTGNVVNVVDKVAESAPEKVEATEGQVEMTKKSVVMEVTEKGVVMEVTEKNVVMEVTEKVVGKEMTEKDVGKAMTEGGAVMSQEEIDATAKDVVMEITGKEITEKGADMTQKEMEVTEKEMVMEVTEDGIKMTMKDQSCSPTAEEQQTSVVTEREAPARCIILRQGSDSVQVVQGGEIEMATEGLLLEMESDTDLSEVQEFYIISEEGVPETVMALPPSAVAAETETESEKTAKLQVKTRETFNCGICGKFYPWKWSLKRHMLQTHFVKSTDDDGIVLKEKVISLFNCDQCDAVYAHENNLLIHKQRHHGEAEEELVPLVGDTVESEKATAETEQLEQADGNEGGHRCSLCGELYGTKQELEGHSCPQVTSKGKVPMNKKPPPKKTSRESTNTTVLCELCADFFPSALGWQRHKCPEQEHGGIGDRVLVTADEFYSTMDESLSRAIFSDGIPEELEDLLKMTEEVVHSVDSVLEMEIKQTKAVNRCRATVEKTPFLLACNICSRWFPTHETLENHLRSVHNSRNVPAPKKRSNNDSNKDDEDWICDICFKRYQYKRGLVEHVKEHKCEFDDYIIEDQIRSAQLKEPTEFLCDVCGIVSTSKDALRHHIRSHDQAVMEEGHYLCEVCGLNFANKREKRHHLKTHKLEKVIWKCQVCDKTFPSNRTQLIQTHVNSHTGDKPFECEICGKRLLRKCHLQSHMKKHESEKTIYVYECGECGKRFRQRSHLKVHIMSHNGEKPHECPDCGKRFLMHSHMKYHQKTVHAIVKPANFTCDVCGQLFVHRHHYKTHMMRHSGEKPYECDRCGKRFIQRSHLKTHIMTHTGEKPHECERCGKRFLMSSHLKSHIISAHTIEKTFECNVCGKKCATHSQFKIHMKIHSSRSPLAKRFKLPTDNLPLPMNPLEVLSSIIVDSNNQFGSSQIVPMSESNSGVEVLSSVQSIVPEPSSEVESQVEITSSGISESRQGEEEVVQVIESEDPNSVSAYQPGAGSKINPSSCILIIPESSAQLESSGFRILPEMNTEDQPTSAILISHNVPKSSVTLEPSSMRGAYIIAESDIENEINSSNTFSIAEGAGTSTLRIVEQDTGTVEITPEIQMETEGSQIPPESSEEMGQTTTIYVDEDGNPIDPSTTGGYLPISQSGGYISTVGHLESGSPVNVVLESDALNPESSNTVLTHATLESGETVVYVKEQGSSAEFITPGAVASSSQEEGSTVVYMQTEETTDADGLSQVVFVPDTMTKVKSESVEDSGADMEAAQTIIYVSESCGQVSQGSVLGVVSESQQIIKMETEEEEEEEKE